MCPGPVNVSPRVLHAMTAYEIGHREVEFSQLLRQIQRHCLELMKLDPLDYGVVVVTGSGSAANEAVITSALQPCDNILSLATGEFGRRLADISSIYNPHTTTFSQEWASLIDLDKVESILKAKHYDWVTMVHHETSTGELQPVKEVGALCKKYGAKLFVDAVSSFMADPLQLDECNVTMMSTSSGKALGMPPGLSIVVGKLSEFEKLSSYPTRNYYLSLARLYSFAKEKAQTPNTPAIHLFIALNEALKQISDEGVDSRLDFQKQKSSALRRGLHNLGLSLLHPNHPLSNAVSSVCLPCDMSFDELRTQLRSYGFIVYGGKGPLVDKIFQISTMGAVGFDDIDALLSALSNAMRRVVHAVS